MRKLLFFAAVALSATAGLGSVQFVAPLEGAQTVGPTPIEIVTDASTVDRVEFRVDGILVGVSRRPPYRVIHDFGTVLTARVIEARVLSNGYKTVENAKVVTAALTAGESITVDLVEVPLRIRSVRGVTAADLRVTENAVEQHIREVRAGREPAHFAFVVDRSLSMGGGRLAAALQAVDEAARLLRAGDTASVTVFNHTVAAPLALSSVRSAARELTPSGGTSLRDALASLPAHRRTYAIVITDGGDRNSAIPEEAALRKISGTRTVVSAVVLGHSSPFLQRAARNTGGSVVRSSTAEVAAVVRRIVTDLNSRYTLVYQSQRTRKGWRTISVEAKRRGIEIQAARKGYFAE